MAVRTWEKLGRILLASLCLTALSGELVLAKSFNDVNVFHPNFVAINFLSDQSILSGYQDGSFGATKLVNRAEAVKIILASFYVNQTIPEANVSDLFYDVKTDDWFAKYVTFARAKGLISGNPDGSFSPEKNVTRAEFLKILLEAAGFNKEAWQGQLIYADVPAEAWFSAYLNYAGKSGLLSADEQQNLLPGKLLSRAEVAQIIYLMLLIINNQNSQFLIDQAAMQISEIENFLSVDDVGSAKKAADLAVLLLEQSGKLKPDDLAVQAKSKIAQGNALLVDSFIKALAKDYVTAKDLAEKSIVLIDQAAQLDESQKDQAEHLKERAASILSQI